MSTTVSATTDRISLVGLSARGHHGVLPFEREEGQLFTVDVVLDLGARGTAVAAVTDSITDAVDYSRVANGIVSIIEGEPVNLIESLADRIAERVLAFPRVVAAEITVHKPEAPLDVAFEDVSVTIHRVADAAAGHDGAPATSQAAWAAQSAQSAQGTEPVTYSVPSFGTPTSPVSSVSPAAAASPAAPAYEPPAATPAAPLVSEVPDLTASSVAAAAPMTPSPELPITPTPSPASPLEAPARSPFAAAAPSVPTPIPADPLTSSSGAASTQPWMPDWSTDSSGPSASSTGSSQLPEPSGEPESYSVAADASASQRGFDSAPTTAPTGTPTAASAARSAGADGFVSLAAEALGVTPSVPEAEPEEAAATGEPEALRPLDALDTFDTAASGGYTGQASLDAATDEADSSADRLAVQLPREGRHVASSEDAEQQAAPVVDSPVDLLGGPSAFSEPSTYGDNRASSYSGASYSADTYSEAAEDSSTGLSGGADDAGGLGGADDARPLTDAGPGPLAPERFETSSASSAQVARSASSPLLAPGEHTGTVNEQSAPTYSGDALYASEPSAPAQPGFPGLDAAGGAQAAPAAPVAPQTPAAPVDPLTTRPGRPVGVVFSLGANVGSVVESLRSAVQGLKAAEGIEVTQVAPLARTIAVVAEGAEPQPDYLNTVVIALTTLSPRELLDICHALEDAAGRVRTEPWGVRTLDVDIIEVEGVTSTDPALSLPHPRAAERSFVLVPWSQADPFAELVGRSVSELAENAPDRGGLRWLAFDWLDSDSLPDKPTGPYVEPPVDQSVGDAQPEMVYDATRDESSLADGGLVSDYAGGVSGGSSASAGPASSQQPLGGQAPIEQVPPFESSYDSDSWSGRALQVESPYQAASAPEASGDAGASGSQADYTPGRVAGVGGFTGDQQDVGSYAGYASDQQEQAGAAAQPQQHDEAGGDAWRSPLQWNDVIGGGAQGAQGAGPRQDV